MASISARLDRLPITSLHRRAVAALAFAYFFELSDLNTFSFAAPAVIHQWHIPVSAVALTISASFAGMFIGAACGGWLADRSGRKRGFIIATLVYTLASLANAASWDLFTLALFRLITGIGLSAMTVIANTYVGEVFPARLRGKYLGIVMTVGLVGIPATAWVSRFVVPLAPWGWRLVFVWGAFGLFALVFAARMIESPRWFHLRGNAARAEEETAALERAARAESGPLAEPDPHADEKPEPEVSYGELFAPAWRNRTAMLLLVWVFQTLGFYGFVSWVPTLLAQHGFTVVRSLTFSSVIALCNPLGALVAANLLERFDRKWLLTVVALLIAASGLAYGMTFEPALIMLFGALVVVGIQVFAVGLYVYTPELYPTRMRGSGHGLTYGVGRLANVVGPFIVSTLYAGYGYQTVFVYIAACWLASAAVVGLYGPLTTGRSLEALNRA
ncbi:MAG TPA: MFS transporter [Acetobacteraceae bacterium]|nr:MFS transporter [Acetobacteraceae bacterium]